MTHYLTCFCTGIFVLLHFQCFSQTYNFNNGPIPTDWMGDTNHFEIDADKRLHLTAPTGISNSSIVWQNTQHENMSWEFQVAYSFAASSTNFALFYLQSIQSALASTSNSAYYLKIGGATGSLDKIELVYQNGASKIVVLESRVGIVGASTILCRIRVTKTRSGKWELYVDTTGENNLTKEAEGNHLSTQVFQYGGLRCVYSSTRRDKFYFDDILICNFFTVSSYQFENDKTLNIFFSDNLSNNRMPDISNDFNIAYIRQVENNYLHVDFDEPLPEGTYTLTLRSAFSLLGDSISSITIAILKEPTYYIGQIRITEFMSDPSPSFGLPEVEWLELKNISAMSIDLAHISISDPTSKAMLPHLIFKPDSVVVICAPNGCIDMPLRNCIEVASFPNLNNSSDSLFVWANDSLLIDFVAYTLVDLPNDYRANGGYSIIRTNMPADCGFSRKLDFSTELIGGSPGVAGSIPYDNGYIMSASVFRQNEITINCDALLDVDLSNIHSPILIDHILKQENKTSTAYTITLMENIEEGTMFCMQIDSMRTCRNQKQEMKIMFDVVYPKSISSMDIYINEVLYNPKVGGVDFIEMYNKTDKYIQLKNTHIFNQSNGKSKQHISISNDCVIKPYMYLVLTSDTATLKQHYPNTIVGNCLQLKNFVTLDDAGGVLHFVDAISDTLDVVYYGDAYHNPLLRNKEGVSLEKINPDLNSFSPHNWTSSAVNCTPGYENSQFFTSTVGTQKVFYCDPCHVTTNSNGVTDFVLMYLNEMQPGFLASIRIYTLTGEKVVDISINQIVGAENSFKWNGQKQNGSLLEDGIYLAVAEWWTSDGRAYRSKIPISTSQY
jgi:hypothetical protein